MVLESKAASKREPKKPIAHQAVIGIRIEKYYQNGKSQERFVFPVNDLIIPCNVLKS